MSLLFVASADPPDLHSVKETNVVVKKLMIIFALCAVCSAIGFTQDSNQTAPAQNTAFNAKSVQKFTRNAQLDGVTLNFVLLNNKTVDFLFSGDSKYSIRAQANAATMFYVQGITDKDITFDPQFEVTQDGKTYPGSVVNLKNLQTGHLAKGTKISGLVQLAQKIDIAQPFKIKGAHNASVEFKLSQDDLKLLEN
jgi:hypothetical protein